MSLFGAISVSASGMEAQRSRAEIITENLANADTTRTPEGGPYKRKDAVFTTTPVANSFSDILSAAAGGNSGVAVSDISVDDRDPERRYMPGHPDADADGYVAFPRDRSSLRDGRPDERFTRLPGECGGHIRGEGYDRAID